MLVELVAISEGAPRRLSIVSGRGSPRSLAAAEAARFLSADRDGQRLWVASTAADGRERLLETSRAGNGRELIEAPPGFRFAAVTPDGALAAMVRAVAPGADEVVLVDRPGGERRLLLPNFSETFHWAAVRPLLPLRLVVAPTQPAVGQDQPATPPVWRPRSCRSHYVWLPPEETLGQSLATWQGLGSDDRVLRRGDRRRAALPPRPRRCRRNRAL